METAALRSQSPAGPVPFISESTFSVPGAKYGVTEQSQLKKNGPPFRKL